MRLGTRERKPIYYDDTLNIDPTSGTAVLWLDGESHPMTIAATQSGTSWKFTATTTELFAGPDAATGTAVTVTAGRHLVNVVLTVGDVILESRDEALDVG